MFGFAAACRPCPKMRTIPATTLATAEVGERDAGREFAVLGALPEHAGVVAEERRDLVDRAVVPHQVADFHMVSSIPRIAASQVSGTLSRRSS